MGSWWEVQLQPDLVPRFLLHLEAAFAPRRDAETPILLGADWRGAKTKSEVEILADELLEQVNGALLPQVAALGGSEIELTQDQVMHLAAGIAKSLTDDETGCSLLEHYMSNSRRLMERLEEFKASAEIDEVPTQLIERCVEIAIWKSSAEIIARLQTYKRGMFVAEQESSTERAQIHVDEQLATQWDGFRASWGEKYDVAKHSITKIEPPLSMKGRQQRQLFVPTQQAPNSQPGVLESAKQAGCPPISPLRNADRSSSTRSSFQKTPMQHHRTMTPENLLMSDLSVIDITDDEADYEDDDS